MCDNYSWNFFQAKKNNINFIRLIPDFDYNIIIRERGLPSVTYNDIHSGREYITMNTCYQPVEGEPQYETVDECNGLYAEVRGEVAIDYLKPVSLRTHPARTQPNNAKISGTDRAEDKTEEDYYIWN